jgi:serine/threonine protein kinase
MELNLNDYITTQDDPEELFQLLEKLGNNFRDNIGQGTYGSVYKALHRASGKIVAAKIISIEGDVER